MANPPHIVNDYQSTGAELKLLHLLDAIEIVGKLIPLSSRGIPSCQHGFNTQICSNLDDLEYHFRKPPK